jgi:hypothetical protein
MSNPNRSPSSRRGLLWLIFRAPGVLFLWIEYHWPKSGDAWGSARRYRQPIFEVLYSLGFWLCFAAFLWPLLYRLLGHG